MGIFRLTICSCLLLLTSGAFATSIEGMRVWTSPDKTRTVFDLSDTADYKLFELDNPPRVVIDFSDTALNGDLNIDKNKDIKGIRYSKKDKKNLRVVLDLNNAMKPKSFLLKPTGKYGHRLVVDLPRSHISKPKVVDDVQKANRDVLIAVDAGHGGEDPGAIGPNGTQEKVVTLKIANKLARLINQEQGMKAFIVRTGDYYIPHRERFGKARDKKADLFVSVHADAFHDRKVNGASVYVLSRKGASSEEAKWLAAKENKSDLIGGVKIEDKQDMLSKVLFNLSQNAAMEESDKAAKAVHGSLRSKIKLHGRGLGRANFLVLKSPDVPSILIETGYISNPNDEKNLNNPEYVNKLGKKIVAGIKNYFYQSPPPNTWIAAHSKSNRYVVKQGETLSHIASVNNTSVTAIRSINNKKSDSIYVGEVLLLPGQ